MTSKLGPGERVDPAALAYLEGGFADVLAVKQEQWQRFAIRGRTLSGAAPPRGFRTDDVRWLATTWDVPVIVKGIAHPADAVTAIDAGAVRPDTRIGPDRSRDTVLDESALREPVLDESGLDKSGLGG